MFVRVRVQVPAIDAANLAQAMQYARELAADLPLKVTLGGVELRSAFSIQTPTPG